MASFGTGWSSFEIFYAESQAGKELSIAEGFKDDYNFLWRLLGRVHAARGAIQVLMGGKVSGHRQALLCDFEVPVNESMALVTIAVS